VCVYICQCEGDYKQQQRDAVDLWVKLRSSRQNFDKYNKDPKKGPKVHAIYERDRAACHKQFAVVEEMRIHAQETRNDLRQHEGVDVVQAIYRAEMVRLEQSRKFIEHYIKEYSLASANALPELLQTLSAKVHKGLW